jgi:hypothetical protein
MRLNGSGIGKGGEGCEKNKNNYSGRVIRLAAEQEVEMEEISQLGQKRPPGEEGQPGLQVFRTENKGNEDNWTSERVKLRLSLWETEPKTSSEFQCQLWQGNSGP